jgi:hypothetical protein
MIWDRRPRLGKGAVEMGGGDTFLSLAWSRKRSAGGIRRPGGWDAFDAAVLKARGLGAVAGRCAPTVPAPKAQPKLGACAAQGRRSVESAQSGPGQPLCSGPETRRDPTPPARPSAPIRYRCSLPTPAPSLTHPATAAMARGGAPQDRYVGDQLQCVPELGGHGPRNPAPLDAPER